jgi:archaellum component FlaC
MNVAQHINYSYTTGNKEELIRVRGALETNLKELDVFFEEYLELFSDQLNASDKTSQVWKAYNDHYKSYENIKNNIKMTNHYLGML